MEEEVTKFKCLWTVVHQHGSTEGEVREGTVKGRQW